LGTAEIGPGGGGRRKVLERHKGGGKDPTQKGRKSKFHVVHVERFERRWVRREGKGQFVKRNSVLLTLRRTGVPGKKDKYYYTKGKWFPTGVKAGKKWNNPFQREKTSSKKEGETSSRN